MRNTTLAMLWMVLQAGYGMAVPGWAPFPTNNIPVETPGPYVMPWWAHSNNTNNPHGVTAAQAGADVVGAAAAAQTNATDSTARSSAINAQETANGKASLGDVAGVGYLLANGTRVATGSLDMGGTNDIANVRAIYASSGNPAPTLTVTAGNKSGMTGTTTGGSLWLRAGLGGGGAIYRGPIYLYGENLWWVKGWSAEMTSNLLATVDQIPTNWVSVTSIVEAMRDSNSVLTNIVTTNIWVLGRP